MSGRFPVCRRVFPGAWRTRECSPRDSVCPLLILRPHVWDQMARSAHNWTKTQTGKTICLIVSQRPIESFQSVLACAIGVRKGRVTWFRAHEEREGRSPIHLPFPFKCLPGRPNQISVVSLFLFFFYFPRLNPLLSEPFFNTCTHLACILIKRDSITASDLPISVNWNISSLNFSWEKISSKLSVWKCTWIQHY